jgi:hypothetical protein
MEAKIIILHGYEEQAKLKLCRNINRLIEGKREAPSKRYVKTEQPESPREQWAL